MKSAVLETQKMEGSHTSENISKGLMETKQKWGLPDCIATTDNAANECKAFTLLNWVRFGCYGHRINLVVRNALSCPEVCKIIAKGRKLVTFFHSSSSITDQLKYKQKLLLSEDKVGHKLIMDVTTRWNSTLAMLERLCEQQPAIIALANDHSISKAAVTAIKNYSNTFEEQSVVERLVSLLAPFEKATTILCSELVPTMHKVLPVVLKLRRAIEISADDNTVVKAVKRKMQSEMEKRTEEEDIVLLATVLNPFTKEFSLCPNLKDRAHQLLRHHAQSISSVPFSIQVKKEKDENAAARSELPALPTFPDEDEETDMEDNSIQENNNDCPSKKIRAADTEDWLEDVMCTGESTLNTQDIVEHEVSNYLGASMRDEDANGTLLQWWEKNCFNYPRLAVMAKKFLCCQASSVPSERVFSFTGNLVNKKRCRLSPENIDTLVFLNKNMKFWN